MNPIPYTDTSATAQSSYSMRSVAWGLFGLCMLFTTFGLILELLNSSSSTPHSTLYPGAVAIALCFPFVGVLIASRYPRNPIGWLFCGMGLSEAIPALTGPYAVYTFYTNPGALPGGALAAWLAVWTWLPGFGLIPLLLLLFPDGTLLSPRWRIVAWLTVLGNITGLLSFALVSWPLRGPDLLFHLPTAGSLYRLMEITTSLLLVGALLASIVAIVRRFRRSQGVERQQLKWFTFATALASTVQAMSIILMPYGGNLGGSLLNMILVALQVITFTSIAVAVGIAILRYRLYDIDIIIRRTLIYTLLTGTLALTYFGIVVLLQQLFRSLTGQDSNAAIVISTLAIAALFNPLRQRIQEFIDRRFYRRKYDAQQTLAAFAATVRNEVELERLTGELLRVIEETMQPAHVSLWLRDVTEEAKEPTPH